MRKNLNINLAVFLFIFWCINLHMFEPIVYILNPLFTFWTHCLHFEPIVYILNPLFTFFFFIRDWVTVTEIFFNTNLCIYPPLLPRITSINIFFYYQSIYQKALIQKYCPPKKKIIITIIRIIYSSSSEHSRMQKRLFLLFINLQLSKKHLI